jgi:site-specific recombinase XerD
MGIYQRGDDWGIDWYDGSKRRRQLVGPSKGEAKALLAVKRAERLRGRREIIPKVDAPAFDQYVEGPYAEYARTNKRGFYNEQYRLKQLTRYFGKINISDLRRSHAERFKSELSHRRAPGTVNRLLGNLKHILSMAVDDELITTNPFVRVKLLHVPERHERILTKEEEERLLAACSQVHTPLLRTGVVISLNTGMRKGEIYGLRWEQVNLADRSIHVRNGKTRGSARRIPMNEAVQELLSELCKVRKGDFVFPSPRKKGERFRDPKVGFMKAVKLAKIPHIRFHDLRHTFATRLVRSGVDIVTVQHLLGHSNIMMTSRYAHSDADAKMDAVERLDFAEVR